LSAPTIVDILAAHAARAPDAELFRFLGEGEDDGTAWTYGDLEVRARAVAVALREHVAPGDRVMLLFPPGLDFIAAFFGCLFAGVIAVPCYPPAAGRPERARARLLAIATSASPSLVLAARAVGDLARPLLTGTLEIPWLAMEDVNHAAASQWRRPDLHPSDLALLQYTSGSTAAPRGVRVSHANLVANAGAIREAFGVRPGAEVRGLSWLPLYHDMGLIGHVVTPICFGITNVFMSPIAFLHRPIRWLRAITRFGAGVSGGPDFAYDLCARRVTERDLEGLDLSGWWLAYCGAEPVRSTTLERFARAFAPVGFRASSFQPCFGLAEATLMVTGGPARGSVEISGRGLESHLALAPEGAEGRRSVVGCGRPTGGAEVRIVDPETRAPLPDDHVGEIWVRGPSVASGYWGNVGDQSTFGATLADDDGSAWMRTGDLGFLRDGELYPTGRRKDVIILNGRKLHAHDLEASVEGASPSFRPGSVAAFGVAGEAGERLVIACETSPREAAEPAALLASIRRAIADAHGADVAEVVLVARGALPKTSSGKLMRAACRDAHAAGKLRRDDAG
jgi:acyl-CoA synthetase (AMP-forming)/AMP-acid ligase II